MGPGSPELLRAALTSVELCEVKADEKVVIFTDSQTDPALSEAWYLACVARGCDPTLIRAMARFPETDPPPAAVASMIESDMVFDIPSTDWEYSPSHSRILGSGTRILQVLLEPRRVADRAPTLEGARRADLSEELLRSAKEIRVATPDGTDLRATLSEERPLDVARGYVREAGQWDSYGTSLIAVAPIEGSVSGHISFNGPLILLPQHTLIVEKPVQVDVEEGRIVRIDDSHQDARTLKRWFEQFDDPNAYVFSHIGWGLDPTADLADTELTAWESLNGGVQVAFGSNSSPHLGGAVESIAHMDGILLDASLWLDGRLLIADGRFTEESGLGA